MEFLALAGGYVLGLAVAWVSFARRCRNRLAEQESRSAEASSQLEQALERERVAHAATKQRLLELERGDIAIRTRGPASTHRLVAQVELAETAQHDRSQISDRALQRGDGDDVASRPVQSALHREEFDASRATAVSVECAPTPHSGAGLPMMGPAEGHAETEGVVSVVDHEIARLKGELDVSRARSECLRGEPHISVESELTSPSKTESALSDPMDDLSKIKGIGPVLKGKLAGLGITSVRQIADFTEDDIDLVNGAVASAERIKREQWVEQARAIVGG